MEITINFLHEFHLKNGFGVKFAGKVVKEVTLTSSTLWCISQFCASRTL